MRTASLRRHCLGIAVLACLGARLASAEPAEVAVSAAMPRPGDHTALSWREGPPYFTSAGYSPERRFLRLQTGFFGLEFDTERTALTGFGRPGTPQDEAVVTAAIIAAEALPPAQLHLGIRVGETTYTCTGRQTVALDRNGIPANPQTFPVRILESGRFFQKFALHDLEFRAQDGRRLAGVAYLEVSAWPDRLNLTLVVRPEESWSGARASLRLQTSGGMDASLGETPATWSAAVEHRATLTLAPSGAAWAPTAPERLSVRCAPSDARARAAVRWNAEENCQDVQLEMPGWPAPDEGIYPESMLDAWETSLVVIENPTAQVQCVRLRFDHLPVHSLTGCVPMILDEQGSPTGLPVQVSKNWHHVEPGQAELPHAGSWLHARTLLNVPPNSRVAFRYGTTFARWGGVPSASVAQLSLVGWGHNGFWDQFALGAFGETFCFQPGRTMRRALLADFRPLFQRGFADDARWAWTSNLGGGDTLVRLDRAGNYVPFKRNVTRHVSSGPNLAHLAYEEVANDDAVHSRVEVMLPRTDDAARVYLRVRYDVRRRVEFSSLALYQLGADYYNDTDSARVAWGNAEGLHAERRPGPEGANLPRWQAEGADPWVSLHGQPRADSERSGQGRRGLIVREWRANLGAKPALHPWFAVFRTQGAGSRLAVQMIPPPGVTALLPGDHVEMLLELLALPLAAERYYGPDEGLRAALATGKDAWLPVQREARLNRPVLRAADAGPAPGFPLTVSLAPDESDMAFTLSDGLGWIPVRVAGLTRPDAIELFRETPAGRERVWQGDPARPFWQSDYDAATQAWSVTYNLPATRSPTTYAIARRPLSLELGPRAQGAPALAPR